MKRVLPSRLQQLCHSSGSTWCFHPNTNTRAALFRSSLSNRQVIGEAASDKNEKNASTTAFEKDQQEFLKNNPSVASVSSYDKSPSAVRKEKEKESSFFDNPNPIPNLNTTEKMANKNPIGSYTPGSYVVGSTTVEEDDSDIPSHHMGKPLDGDPNLFFGFDDELYEETLYTEKDTTAKFLGNETNNSGKGLNNNSWKSSSINKDQQSEIKEKTKE